MYIYTYLKCANPTCQYYVHRLRLRKRLLAPLLGGVQICGSIREKKTPHNKFFSNHMICWICLYRCETRAAQPAQLS